MVPELDAVLGFYSHELMLPHTADEGTESRRCEAESLQFSDPTGSATQVTRLSPSRYAERLALAPTGPIGQAMKGQGAAFDRLCAQPQAALCVLLA